ncbi:MAG: 50S ribosomal protein L4 [Candidatus Pacebacteria bacterium]|nr:50S ribosomal protein L4 [Candidatus Paceibacterota bacterium]
MKLSVYNQEGKELDQVVLPKDIFDVELNPDLVYQVVVSQMANRRMVLANTKSRGEVSGTGKKPWRQKGTGRARHGSRRSPIWRGGGITFGPRKGVVYDKKINKKMQRKALFMVLSEKARKNLLLILDEISLEKPKTKLMANILLKLPVKGSVLFALTDREKGMNKAIRNISGVDAEEARNLNALDLLSYKYLIMPKEGIKTLKEVFAKQ